MDIVNVLIIDDEPRYREIASNLVKTSLPDAHVHAPDTLAEAISMIKDDDLNLVFIDAQLSSNNYQPWSIQTENYETVRGWEIVPLIKERQPEAVTIGFSLGGMLTIGHCTQINFAMKRELMSDDEGVRANAVERFRELMNTALRRIQ